MRRLLFHIHEKMERQTERMELTDEASNRIERT